MFLDHTFPFFLLALLLTASLGGCGATDALILPADRTSSRADDTLVIALESRTDVLDPHVSTGWVSFRVLYQVFEGLVTENLLDPDLEVGSVEPALATSWEHTPDGKVFTFTLREGVKFHDGTAFNAEAVLFNIERMWDENAPHYVPLAAKSNRHIWEKLESVEALDPMTVRFSFSAPFYEFPAVLAQVGIGSAMIISPGALETWGNEGIGQNPVGTGPFVCKEITDEKIVVQRNPDYWNGEARLREIEFLFVPDSAARVDKLREGLVDLIFVPPPDKIELLVREGYILSQGLTAHVWFLSLNTREPVLQDDRVRLAIASAVDKEGIAGELLKNTARPARGLQAPGNTSFDPNFAGIPYDPEKAKQLLAEAGYAPGLHFKMQTSVSGSGQVLPVHIAKRIQQDLHRVGIITTIETYEWIDYIDLWASGIQDGIGFNQLSWGMSTNYWLQLLVHSAAVPPRGYNTNYYFNEEVDDLLHAALFEPDEEQRALLYHEADRKVIYDCWHIPVINDLAPIVMKPTVKGFVHALSEWYDLKQVWIDNSIE